jgi:hypothetical protein
MEHYPWQDEHNTPVYINSQDGAYNLQEMTKADGGLTYGVIWLSG